MSESNITPTQIEDQIEFMEEYCKFGDEQGYILLAKARKQHNEGFSNSDEITRRRMITSTDEISTHYKELRAIAETHPGLTFRMYLTINPRDLITAYFNLRDRVNDWSRSLYEQDTGIRTKFGRIGSEWKSCAHRPEAKADSLFLFDLDGTTRQEVAQFTSELQDAIREGAEIKAVIETPNGYHIISDPFNHTNFNPTIEYDELKQDAQLFIEEFET